MPRNSGKLEKSFLSDKVTTFLNILLVENDKIISDESKVTKPLSKLLKKLSLGIKTNEFSNDNYGKKIQLKLLLKNASSSRVSIFLNKIL